VEWFRERHDLIVLNRIRDAFKNQFYGTIEVWRLFGANVTLNVWESHKGKENGKSQLLYFIYFFIFRDVFEYLKNFNKINDILIDERPLIVEAISDDKRINGFWLPIVENYDFSKVILVADNISIYEKYSNHFKVQLLIKFDIFDWINSRIFVIRFIFRNFYFLFFRKSLFYPISSIQIINIFILQINTVTKFKWLVKKFAPKGFLTFWDWYDIGSAGTSVFKSKGLPTFTFIHGAAGKESLKEFIPLNADYIFSWGKYHTESLCDLGIDRKKILQCGCQRMEDFSSNAVEKPNEKGNSMLILMTAMIDSCFIDDILDIVILYSLDCSISIRLHPSTKLRDLDKNLQTLDVHYLTTDDESIEVSISKSDIIIVDTSTAGFDAINMDKPVFVIDSAPIKRPQDIMDDIVNYGAAIFCSSAKDFDINFQKYQTDPEFRSQLAINRKKFVNDFICDYGDQATEKMIKKIEIITNK